MILIEDSRLTKLARAVVWAVAFLGHRERGEFSKKIIGRSRERVGFKEFSKRRRDSDGRLRRWFQSDDDDLFVWYSKDATIYGFQLCYDRKGRERALTWVPERGFSHDSVEAEERVGLGYKSIPMLVPDSSCDPGAVARRFHAVSSSLPPEISEFVSTMLTKYCQPR